MKLKTLCSVAILCFMGSVFAMDSDSQKDPTLNSEKFGQSTSADQSNLENLSKEELLKVTANLQQKVEKHESVLAEVLDKTIHTEKEEVLKERYDQLIAAVKSRNIEKLKSLIDQNIDVDETVYGKFATSLTIAGQEGNKDVAEFLLNNGANLQKSPKALIYAVQNGKTDLVKLLLERGADSNVIDDNGCSMLSIALKEGHLEIVKLFLSDSDNRPTLDLLYAGKYKKPMSEDDIIKVKEKLISFKHYDSPDKFGKTPLMYAISSKKISDEDRIEIVRFLLKKKKVTINHFDDGGRTALTYAKSLKKNEIVKLLEDAGATEGQEIRDVRIAEHNDIQSSTDNGKSPMVALYEFCQRKKDPPYSISDRDFDYIEKEGKYNYVLEIDGEKFSQDTFYKSKKDAKNAIAAYVLYVLRLRYSVTDNRSPEEKLKEYLRDNRMLRNYRQWYYEDGAYYNSIIKIGDKEYNLDLHCESPKEAKNTIAEHVYNVLIKEEAIAGLFNAGTLPQASSSGTNQQSSSVVNGNTTAGLFDNSTSSSSDSKLPRFGER
ncbi:MAG: ankyrin repeat domain-containing protein [Alphaproteobacteria bacterium]|nr:ankyrin repeat domain-containing protein [Alphaproteobacteria bacterium]